MKEALEKLEARANVAGGVRANMIAAHGAEREAQGVVLRALVKAVLPALPALVTSMIVTFGDDLVLPRGGRAAAVEGNFFRLGDPTLGIHRTLYLDAAGLLWWANRDAGRWESVLPEEAAASAVWPIEAWIGMLSIACEAASEGRMRKGAQKARKRAEQLGALAVLLDVIAAK